MGEREFIICKEGATIFRSLALYHKTPSYSILRVLRYHTNEPPGSKQKAVNFYSSLTALTFFSTAPLTSVSLQTNGHGYQYIHDLTSCEQTSFLKSKFLIRCHLRCIIKLIAGSRPYAHPSQTHQNCCVKVILHDVANTFTSSD